MDHHCVYAANCVGARNHKQYLLLLLYSAACAGIAATASLRIQHRARLGAVLGGGVLVLLAWIVALILSQIHGIAVDAGTVDRMQRAARLQTPRARAWASLEAQGSSLQGGAKQGRTSLAVAGMLTAPPTGMVGTTGCSAGHAGAAAPGRRLPGHAMSGGSVWSRSRRFWLFVRNKWWTTLREETLGEGSWLMWFVPVPASLSPRVMRRVYLGSE